MSKKVHITFDDGKEHTLIFTDQSQGLLSFLLDLSEKTCCEIELLSGFSNEETSITQEFWNRLLEK
jgi:hypothetical protein